MKPALRFSQGKCLVSGHAVYNSLDNLSQQLLAEAGKAGSMIIDLKDLSDCDSAFVALLTACLQIKTQQQQPLVLSNSPDRLLAMLDVYKLSNCGLQIK
jgi:ABC-type transporter Mla MlaB component